MQNGTDEATDGGVEQFEVMAATLGENAAWKQIQKNTFTRWCNEQLKCVDKRIMSLDTDFSDGLRLIALLEVLSHKKMGRHNKRPNFRQMKLENVSVALKFLETENIKLVSIDSKAIVDGNLKLILGLVWTLILNYSISMPVWDDGTETEEEASKSTPKQRLLGWIQNKVPQLPITNFTKNWHDGIALGALVDNCAPGLCPDWEDWSADNKVENAGEAMKLAEDWLGVPQVITPEEITNPNVDELSVMTYLSEFPKAQLKPGAPLRPRTNAKKARAYGKGIEPHGCKVGVPSQFTVETFGAGNGTVMVHVTGPDDRVEEVKAVANNDKLMTYSVTYLPKSPGTYQVSVLFAGSEIQKSPFAVNVEDCPSDSSKVIASGAGLQTGNIVGKPTSFDICTEGAGPGELGVTIVDPDEKDTAVFPDVVTTKDDCYTVTYTPKQNGLHKVLVTHGGTLTPSSPYLVTVSRPFDPKEVWVEGSGIEPDSAVSNQSTDFIVHTERAGDADLDVKCIGPRGVKEDVSISDIGEGLYSCRYTPSQPGQHIININYGHQPAASSPYRVNVAPPPDPTKVQVEGPGVSTGNMVGIETHFDVLTADCGRGDVDVRIRSDGTDIKSVPIRLEKRENDTVRCFYKPESVGKHEISVTFGDQAISKSPYLVEIVPAWMHGSGLEEKEEDDPLSLDIDDYIPTTSDIHDGDDSSRTVDGDAPKESGERVVEEEEIVAEYKDRTLHHSFYPDEGVAVAQERLLKSEDLTENDEERSEITAFDADACRAFGRGIQSTGLRLREKAEFHVSVEGAGEAELKALLRGTKSGSEPVTIRKSQFQTQIYDCEYYPPKVGDHKLDVTYGGKHISKSPFKINIGPVAGPQKFRVFGPGLEGGKVGESADFVVETVGEDHGKLGFSIEGPSSAAIDCTDKGDGSCNVKYHPLQPGEYAVHVTCDDSDIKGSPFMARIAPADNSTFPDKVVAFGPGLESNSPVNGERTTFTIDTSKAGDPAPVGVICRSDGEVIPVDVHQLENGVYECGYTPKNTSKYTIIPTYDGVALKNSPFRVEVLENSYPSRVKVRGPGVGSGLRANEPTHFVVDCSNAGRGDVAVNIKCSAGTVGAKEADVKLDIVKDEDDVHTVRYKPTAAGKYTVTVEFAGKPVPSSPLQVTVDPSHDASKVWVEGPGLYSDGLTKGESTQFNIFAWEGGKAKPEVLFTSGETNQVPVKDLEITETKESTYTVRYCPDDVGDMDVDVKYGGDSIPGSPFRVHVLAPLDLSQVKVMKLDKNLDVGKLSEFQVEAARAGGKGVLDVSVIGPALENVDLNKKEMANGTKYYFTPETQGPHRITVNYDGTPVEGSPFLVSALTPPDASKVRVYGLGLTEGVTGSPARFTVNTKATENGDVGVKVEGPCEAEIECIDKGDSTCAVSYLPTKPGNYKINVLYSDDHVPGSPFYANIESAFDASKVHVDSSGAQAGKVGQPYQFEVDCRKAGNAQLVVDVQNEDGSHVALTNFREREVKIYCVTFIPNKPGVATASVMYGDAPVPDSPVPIKILPDVDVRHVTCSGRGIQSEGVFHEVEAPFAIDAKSLAPSGGDHICAKLIGPDGSIYPVELVDNTDGTYDAKYTATEKGPHQLLVDYDEVPVPGSPFPVWVTEGCEASNVKAYGPGLENGLVDQPCRFTVDTRGAGVGNLGLAVEGPCDAKISCTDKQDGTCTVEYLPTAPGKYQVLITYGGDAITGSPFNVAVKNELYPHKVTCDGRGLSSKVRAKVPQEFVVDCREAGVAPLEVAVKGPDGKSEEVEIVDNKDGTHTALFTPSRDGPHRVQVKYGDEEIPRSPYRVLVLPTHDASEVKCSGPGLSSNGVLASLPVQFYVDASDAGEAALNVDISDSRGRTIPNKIVDNSDHTYTVSYLPSRLGPYTISTKYGGDSTPDSPYRVRARPSGDASKCHVFGDGLGPVYVGEEGVISVEPSEEAGPGKVNCDIATSDGRPLITEVVENNDGTYDVFYTPRDEGAHRIELTYGGEDVPGSPYLVEVEQSNKQPFPIKQEQIQMTEATPVYAAVNGFEPHEETFDGPPSPVDDLRPVELTFDIPSKPGTVTSVVTTPSGRKEPAEVRKNEDGTVTIDYQPSEKGLHHMGVFLNDQHITGSPIQFYADLVAPGHVTAYGPGLMAGKSNEVAEFTVVTKDVGSGGLSLAVEGPSKAEITCKGNKDGTCSVSYLPTAPGRYNIAVKFDDKHIHGSPFTANISTAQDRQKSKLTSGIPGDLSLKLNEADPSLLHATIESPSGLTKDCTLKKLPHGHIGLSFTPNEPGDHVINVTKGGRHVTNSPFRVVVEPSEVGDASKVRVEGGGCEKAKPGEEAQFIVDSRYAGYGGLGLSVEGPSPVEINCVDLEAGVTQVCYTPQEAGTYLVNVKFADQNVPGSPFYVTCAADEVPLKETVTKQQKAAPLYVVGDRCDLKIKLPESSIADLVAEVESPSGHKSPAEIIQVSDRMYDVIFTPREPGVHTIGVTHAGEYVAGSPFKFTVGHLATGGASKVTAGGPGLKEATTNEPGEFSVWTREGGAGGLSIAVEGPSRAEITLEDKKDGLCEISYVVTQPGSYEVSVKFNDEHIPGSPYPVTVIPGSGEVNKSSSFSKSDAFKVRPFGSGLRKAMIGDGNTFTLDCSHAGSDILLVGVRGPHNPCEEVNVKHIGKKRYAVTYSVQERGDYCLIVMWGNDHVPGSPFYLTVSN